MTSLPVRLRHLTPDQALAVFEVLAALETAFWEAYEPVILPLLLDDEVRPSDDPLDCPTGCPEDDIPF